MIERLFLLLIKAIPNMRLSIKTCIKPPEVILAIRIPVCIHVGKCMITNNMDDKTSNPHLLILVSNEFRIQPRNTISSVIPTNKALFTILIN